MKRSWVLIICALIIVGAVVLARLDFSDAAPVSSPAIDQPVVATGPPPPPPRDLEEPASVVADAGVAPRLHEVRLHVTKNGATAVGARLTLKGPTETIGGTVDTMGNLVLPLNSGDWYVRPRAEPNVLRITPDTTEADVTLLGELVMSGRVVDPNGQPLGAVIVELRRNGSSGTTMTKPDGTFSIPATTDEVYSIQAMQPPQRSRPHFARPQEGITLVLEPTWEFTVGATGPGADVARIVVRHRFGMNTCIKTCIVQVPEGEVVSSAVSFDGTRLTAAKPTTDVVKSKGGRNLKLDAVPPLTGRLLDAQNNPVPGATLRLNRFDLGNAGYLDPTAMPKPMGFDNTVITASDGSFSVNFPLENFPIWVMTADAPRELDHRVLVVPFDGPIEVRVK